jgi:hypothetical protein
MRTKVSLKVDSKENDSLAAMVDQHRSESLSTKLALENHEGKQVCMKF